VMTCESFKSKSAAERKTVAETHRLCFNCLGSHPIAKCQSIKTCSTCKSRHHSLLHDAYVPSKSSEVSALSATRSDDDRQAILLATARVSIADRHGHQHATRVLIDQGSEVSLISEALVQRLRLPRSRSSITISGIGGARTGPGRGKVTLNLTSQANGAKFTAVAFILPRLSLYQGTKARDIAAWPHVEGLQLADPRFMDADPIELLLGAEVCSLILQEGLRKGDPLAPVAQRTILGWILSGGCSGASTTTRSSFQCTADQDLATLVLRFWEQEKEAATPAALKPDDQLCEDIFVRTHKRTAEGRYMVRLPFTSPPTVLTETRKPAQRLLSAMERKSGLDPRFGELYRNFLQEYENLNHMELVQDSSNLNQGKCYLPHHGVLRESSATTKLRVVFNGSQRIRSGESLNSQLLIGPNLLPVLADVLMRWRWHRYALATDIEKMYRQILIFPEDREYQRILWRLDTSNTIREYRLNTVTYGLACAPYLAIRTLHQLADDEGSRFPLGAAALRRDCYVDDILTGANTKKDAIALQSELRQLCMAGGFPLRKWAANHEEILADIPPEHCLAKESHSWEHDSHTTLGLRWHPTEDAFAFVIQSRTITEYTKRRVLAETARLFDPLGWLTPIVIKAKILIQSAWLQRLDWDDALPPADAKHWQRLFDELPQLERLRINRWVSAARLR